MMICYTFVASENVTVGWIEVDADELRTVENEYIDTQSPLLNGTHMYSTGLNFKGLPVTTLEQIEWLQRTRGWSNKTTLFITAVDRLYREERNEMAKGKFYIEVDSYWANSKSVFIGPFDSEAAAQESADNSQAVRHGRHAEDVKNNVRYEIRNTTDARKSGMDESNTGTGWDVPNDTQELQEIRAYLAERYG